MEDANNEKIKGVGDIVAKATDKLGIPKCGGCAKRQEFLNKHLPLTFNKSFMTPSFKKTIEQLSKLGISIPAGLT